LVCPHRPIRNSINTNKLCHSREGGNPFWLAYRIKSQHLREWIPAFAGMTGDWIDSPQKNTPTKAGVIDRGRS